jgi:hypothetical protein
MAANATAGIEVAFPFDNGTGFLNGYLLQVPKQGDFLWNDAPVDGATLTDYAREYAQRHGEGDRLVVEFEPGTPADRSARVRRELRDSELCRQGRCVEAGWGVKRTVVY